MTKSQAISIIIYDAKILKIRSATSLRALIRAGKALNLPKKTQIRLEQLLNYRDIDTGRRFKEFENVITIK